MSPIPKSRTRSFPLVVLAGVVGALLLAVWYLAGGGTSMEDHAPLPAGEVTSLSAPVIELPPLAPPAPPIAPPALVATPPDPVGDFSAQPSPAVPKTPVGDLHLRGRVVDEAGHPVAQAVVRFVPIGRSGTGLLDGLREGGLVGAVSSGDGTFRFPVPTGYDIVLFAEAPEGVNLAPSDPAVAHREKVPDDHVVELVLPYGDLVEGFVLGEQRQPVVGARVTARHPLLAGEAVVSTDADGRFAFDRLNPREGLREITVTAPGYLPATRARLTSADNPVLIHMVRPGTVGIDVRLGGEAGPRPALVELSLLERDGSGQFGIPDMTGFRPKESGRNLRVTADQLPHSFHGLAHGEYRVVAFELDPQVRETTGRVGEADFSLPESEAATVLVVLHEGITMEGRVVMLGTEEPVADARVTALRGSVNWNRRRFGSGEHEERTDAGGRFRFTGMAPGEYRVVASKPGLAAVDHPAVTVGTEELPREVVLRMTAPGTVFGRVTGLAGEPIAGASVALVSDERGHPAEPDPEWRTPFDTQTDSEGRYRIEGVPPGEILLGVLALVEVRDGEQYRSEQRAFPLMPGEEREENFDLEPRVRLHGNLVFNGRTLLDTARFGAHPDMMLDEDELVSVIFAVKRGPGFTPAEDDDYEVWVWPGRYHLRGSVDASNPSYGAPVFRAVDVPEEPRHQRVDLNQQVHEATVVIDLPDPLQPMQGRLWIAQRLADGRVIEPVHAEELHAPIRRLAGLPEGEYRAEYRVGTMARDSAWTRIGPGRPNVFYIPDHDAHNVALGHWHPPGTMGTHDFFELSREITLVTLDAAEAIRGPGLHEVRFAHQIGLHALVLPFGIQLLDGETVVASDGHLGWSGTDRREVTYYLEAPPDLASPRIRFHVFGHGGTFGHGLVRITRQ